MQGRRQNNPCPHRELNTDRPAKSLNYTQPAPSQSCYTAVWNSKVAGVMKKKTPLYPFPLHSVRIRWQVSILVYLKSAQLRSRSTSSFRPSARKSGSSVRIMPHKLFYEAEDAFTSGALRQKRIKAHMFTFTGFGWAVLHRIATHTDVPLQHSTIVRILKPRSLWWTRSGLAKFNPQEGHIIR